MFVGEVVLLVSIPPQAPVGVNCAGNGNPGLAFTDDIVLQLVGVEILVLAMVLES